MTPTERALIVVACRNYIDAKTKLRTLFPGITTTAELDQFASLIMDIASEKLAEVITSDEPRKGRSLGRVDSKVKKPEPVTEDEPYYLVDRIEAVLKGRKPMTSQAIVDAIVSRGWMITSSHYPPKKLVLNTLLKNATKFVRRSPGHYALC